MAYRPKRKVIITCAVTGAIHTPTMSPHLPITPQEIADAAVGAAQAGAAIVHLHARDPHNGKPSQEPALFEPFLKEIKANSNVVINITTGRDCNLTCVYCGKFYSSAWARDIITKTYPVAVNDDPV